MPHSPKCNDVVAKDTFRAQSELPPSPPSYPSAGEMKGRTIILGLISAILSLLIVPEIFGSAAIILGAYSWRREPGNGGLYVVILGIICMLVGIYFTSYFALIDLLA